MKGKVAGHPPLLSLVSSLVCDQFWPLSIDTENPENNWNTF